MKKITFLFLALLFVAGEMYGQEDKKKVGIYIVDESKMNMGAFAGEYMGDIIVKRGTYTAVDRTADFLAQLKKEHQFQASGQVDDKDLVRLGKNAGLNLLCVVKVVRMGEQHYMLSARLVDVETAHVEGTARPQKFAHLDEIENVCEAITASLFGERRSGGNSSGSSGSTSSGNTGATRTHPAEPEMVFVKGGSFLMGCTGEQDNCGTDESPTHYVTVSDFYIGKYEVTQAQWAQLMGTSVRQQGDKASSSSSIRGEGANYPMYYVSWSEAQMFIERLNAATGKRYRLPTEAEWEYAARGGSQSKGNRYAGSNFLENAAWFKDNSGSSTHPVGTKQANELGIYDMSGNVWEWCYDWYGAYSSSSQTNPTGAGSGSDRVFRGGSWNASAQFCRVALRNNNSPDFRYGRLGFRLVLSSE